jgi:AcrR family transcriptional regulator
VTSTSAPHRGEATRALILKAAVEEFAAFGYRRSSVDSVSRRAGISRATLYLHWRSKEQLFRALVEHLHEQHLAEMEAVLANPPAGVEEGLTAILRARFGRFVELTSTSPNAAELYDVHDRVCGDIARAASQRGEALVARFLRTAVRDGQVDLSSSGLSVEQAATLLLTCAHAAKGDDPSAATAATYSHRLRQLMRLVVHGLVTPPVGGAGTRHAD